MLYGVRKTTLQTMLALSLESFETEMFGVAVGLFRRMLATHTWTLYVGGGCVIGAEPFNACIFFWLRFLDGAVRGPDCRYALRTIGMALITHVCMYPSLTCACAR